MSDTDTEGKQAHTASAPKNSLAVFGVTLFVFAIIGLVFALPYKGS